MGVSKPRLYLCKPDRTIIADLSGQAYSIMRKLKLGNISELNFTLPLYIEENHEQIKNKNINLVRFKYLIKFQIDNETEWYIIKNPISNMDENIDEFNVECFSLPYELNNYLIRSYLVESKTLSQIANDLLKNTNWSLEYVNAEFDIKYRAFEITEDKVLGAILDLATTFNAIIKWDSQNRKISFYKPEQIGNYNGLNFQYGKYLKSLNQSLDTEDFCTRLRIYGQNGLSINEYNITGSNYLDNFGYFIYPYEEDVNGSVIQSSDYMSDGLCHAILMYNKLLAEKDGEFNNYTNQLDVYNGEILILRSELTALQDELHIILDSLDIAQANNQNTSVLWQQKTNKETEIQNKDTAINNKQTQINNIKGSINTLGQSLSMESNFTELELLELNNYIIEKTVENEYIFNVKELLDWGKEQFEKVNAPQILIDINTLNIDQFLDDDCQLDKGKLILGDIVRINHALFTINVMAKIIEMEIDYESSEINLIISNIEYLNKDVDKFIKKINQAVSTSRTVDMEKFKWNSAVWNLDEVSQILNNVWDATERNINSGVNNSVVTDRRGITVYSVDNPDKLVRIVAGTIGVSGDGGKTYHQAITGDGIYGERIISNIIASSDLTITNTNGSFYVNENGVVLDGMSLEITGGLPKEQISQEYTDYIETQIEESNTAIEQLEINVNDMLNDLKITSLEVNTLKISLNSVIAESTDMINIANSLSITTEKTNYSTALSELQTELNKWIDKANYPLSITINDRSNIINCFKNVENKKSILINKIMAVREQNAKNASVGKGELINGIKIDTQSGLTVTRSDNKVRSILNATSGIKIQARPNTSSDWDNSSAWDKFYVDSDGNLKLKGFIEIGSSSSIFKADNNGIYLGDANFNYAPFKVSLSGNLTATSANIQGNIDCTSLKIYGTDILNTLNQIRGSYIEGSTIQNLNASNISAGTIKADRISTIGLKAQYIQDDVYENTVLHLNNNELVFSRASNNYFGIHLGTSDMSIHYRDKLFLSADTNITRPLGIWDFNLTTVQNLYATAVFG